MASMVSLPSFHLDTRIAESPVTGIRFQLDARVGELDQAIASLERELVEASARRANLRQQLLRAENERRAILENLAAHSREQLMESFGRSEEVQTRLAVAESEIEGLRERIEGVRMQSVGLRHLSRRFLDIKELDVPVDDTGARVTRATRQLLQMVDEDHAATVEDVLAGPLEQLAGVALTVELAGRRSDEPEQLAEDVARARAATRDAMEEMDRVLFRLRPDGLGEDGLVIPVRRLVNETVGDCAVRLQVVGEERRLRHSVELAAFRVIEAAVDNAVEHGRPGSVDVVISFSADRLVLLVRDDGEGFDVPATEARLGRTKAMGLITMRERAELEGGTVEVRSLLGVGTEVRATFPTS